MINLKPLIILNVIALLLSIASIAFVYYLADTITKIETDFDNAAAIKQLDNVNDIAFLREAMKASYRNNSKNILDLADVYKSFASYLEAFLAIFFANLFLIYLVRKRQISNNAFKRDTEKSPRPLT